MQCPHCNFEDSKVLESRSTDDGRSIRRRRECPSCQNRFTTYERLERAPIVVVKNSGKRELFDTEKLVASIIRSCDKTQLETQALEAIAESIESRLNNQNNKEISSSEIGNLVLEELKELDQLAYLRYASIFKKFTDIDEFFEEIKNFQSLNQNLTLA